MKILQIAVGVSASKVYNNLFSELKNKEVPFSVYAPLHHNTKLNDKDYSFSIYSNQIIKRYDKYLYYTKINRMVRDIESNFNMKEIFMVHAHSLFSDGAVAYEIYKKYNIPYVVAIRNYDINKYFKYGIHLRRYANKILLNAKKIIFISPSYKKKVIENYVSKRWKDSISNKSIIVPNGIEEYWVTNKEREHKKKKENIRLIFVGRIDKNKNLEVLIKTIILMIENGNKCSLDVIGDGPLREELQNKYNNISEINFHGSINDMEKLKSYYNENDILVVPSLTETFGLVYLEAMSCGLPVIYTKNQGFDGQFEEGIVGFHIKPSEPNDILKKIEKIKENYETISQKCIELIDNYTWSNIADEYIKVYYESN